MSDGLGIWDDSPEEIRELTYRKVSRLPYPQTGWKPPTEWPNIQHAKWIGVDTETFDPELGKPIDAGPGWARGKGHIVGVSLAVEGAKWYFPMRHEVEKENNLDPNNVLHYMSWALGGDGYKIGANLMYDDGWLKHEGVVMKGKFGDVQIAESLINETTELGLGELGYKYLGHGKTTDLLEEWILAAYGGAKTRWRKNIYRAPPSLVGPYAEDDADMPHKILVKQWPIMKQDEVLHLFELECRLIRLFVKMRFAGQTVDVPYAHKLYDEFTGRVEVIMDQAKHIVGMPNLNINSSDSMAKAFDQLGLTYYNTAGTDKKPDGQPSFTADFLKTIDHPFAKKVLEGRGLEKLANTFLKSYIIENSVNNKVYCSFSLTKSDKGGTRTGRLAADTPNLQNIPIRTEEGRKIRAAFIMDSGHKQLRDYDYSQIEYRMLAHFATGAGSDELRARYANDPTLDYHNLVGDMIFDLVQIRLARGYVKNVNFGIVYGVGIKHLAEMLGLTVEAAEELLSSIHKAIPFAKSTMDDLSVEVNRTGIVKTILGRRSHFDLWEPTRWDVKKRGFMPTDYRSARAEWGSDIIRSYLYRALNYRLQGSAAEFMKTGMDICETNGIFDEIGVPRLTVHDELLFSDPGGIREDAWKEMAHVFETCIPCKVPIRFDGGVGLNWMTAH